MQLIFNSIEEVVNFVRSLKEVSASQTKTKAQQNTNSQNQASQTTQAKTQEAKATSSQTSQKTQPTDASQSQKITDKQLKLLFILFKKLNIQDREIRLNTASKILNKRITSFTQLTKTEATRLINILSEKVPA